MNQDIRLIVTLPTHPKTIKLMRSLGDRAFYNLVRLWCWVGQNKPDGNLENVDVEDIEIAADWAGKPGVFVAALAQCRFLDEVEGHYAVHDWEKHNTYAAHALDRRARAQKGARARWNKEDAMLNDAKSNAKSTNKQCPLPAPSPAPAPIACPIRPEHEADGRRTLSWEALSLCNALRDSIIEADPKAEKKLPGPLWNYEKGWGKDARLLLTKDERPYSEAYDVLEWARADSFWSSNILSMGTFREQYMRLKAQMNRAPASRIKKEDAEPQGRRLESTYTPFKGNRVDPVIVKKSIQDAVSKIAEKQIKGD